METLRMRNQLLHIKPIKKSLCIILFLLGFIPLGCSLPTVYNLNVLNRIPHEINKGFVQFIGQVEQSPENGSISWDQIPYKIEKSEHSYRVDILELSVSMTSRPVSDRPGFNTYIIKFPQKMLLLNHGTFVSQAVGSSKGALANFTAGTANIRYSKKEDIWVSEEDFKQDKFTLEDDQKRLIVYGQKEIEVKIITGMVSPITLKYQLHLTQDGDIQQYSGNLVSVEREKPAPIEFFEDLPKGIYGEPKIYDAEFEKLFSKVLETSKKLGWETTYSDKEEGKLIFKKSRFPAEPLFFTVGIFKAGDEKSGVTISSDSNWQRWGSINTNLSVQNINAFFSTLDVIVNI